jgi:hypothetical protein
MTPADPSMPSDAWYRRSRPARFQPLRPATSRFTVEYPKEDWLVTLGGDAALATFTHRRGEAAVVIERSTLNQPLAPGDITGVFAEIEMDLVRERIPEASGFEARLIEAGSDRVVAIQYLQPGLKGVERVRQYSIARGQDLYRLVCRAGVEQFPRHEAVFAHIAASFTAANAGS